MLVKNQIYEAEITDYTAEGQGVAHIEGCAVFIPNAVAGEKVRVRVEKAQKTWAAGKIVEILEKSPHRVNRECEVAKLCGGCDFWHMDYAEETRLKAERVKNCLNRIGGENLAEVPILAAPDCHGYRNKAQYPVAVKKGRAYAGFYRAGTHDVVENARCRILPEEIDAAKDAVIDYVNQYRVSVYDETTGKGLLRHIYVRRGAVSGQVLVCLAVNGEKIPRPEALVQRLGGIPGFTTLVLSVNTKRGNAVLGDRFLTLHGPGYIEDTLCGLNFRLSPRSFYQVNHHQAQRLYQMAISQAEITKADTVLATRVEQSVIAGYAALAKAAGFKLYSIDLGLAAPIKAVRTIPALQSETFVLLHFDDDTVSACLFVKGQYTYSTRSRLFNPRGSAESGAEIAQKLSGILQFHIAGKSENPITTVYFAGADADDLAVCRPGCEALSLRVAQFPDSPTVKLPEGTALAQTLSAAGNLIAR